MSSYNKVLLMGNLTRDVELRYTAGNVAIAKLGLAVNDRYKDRNSGEWVDRANFIDCTAFGRTAEVINQYFQKGRPIFVEGKLRWDSWEDKQSGQKRSKLEVIIDSFEFIGDRSGGGDGQGGGGQQGGGSHSSGHEPVSASAGPAHQPISEDDIPF